MSRRLEAEAEWKMMLEEHAKPVSEWEEFGWETESENVCKNISRRIQNGPKSQNQLQMSAEQPAPEREGGPSNDSDDSEDDCEE